METPVSNIVTTGDLGGQKVKMSFDENSLAHLMSVLTDLYSDPQLAVIREYSTNALDSHVEAGNTAPIEIYTPTPLSPYFKIKDYGVGLSVDDITEMYSKYGASTKRGTNEQVGMLGIGAKSALTLVPQFTLISVKNGVQIYVSVSRNSDGAGQMEIVDTKATDEPNGVEIAIPVPRNHDFQKKCRDFFRFWKPGTVLVDGKAPEHIDGRPVGERFILNKNLQQDYIVMGNVAYPCKEGIYRQGYSYNQMGIVAFVNIGDINFTPSREQLHYTPKTKATLDALRKEFEDNLVASINKDIAESATYAEAWKKGREWRASFYGRLHGLVYKGQDVPLEIPTADAKVFRIVGKTNRYNSWLRGMNPELAGNHIFVTGFAESMKISPVQREKVAIYCEENDIPAEMVAITKAQHYVTDPKLARWMSDFVIVPWADIAKIKVQRNKSTNRVIRTDPYDLFNGSYGTTQVSTLDTSKSIVFYSSAELYHPAWLQEMLGKDAQLVVLSKNRWEKFKRDWPMAKHYLDACKEVMDKLVVKLTDEDKILWHYSSYRYAVRGMEANRIDDPDLHLFVEVLGKDASFSTDAIQLRNMMRRDLHNPVIDEPGNPLTKYPLLGNIGGQNIEHVYWYLNTYYAHLKEN